MAVNKVKKHFHHGLVHVSDGKCRPQLARLKLSADLLVLQREEFVFPDDDDDDGGYSVDSKLRTVKLKRQPGGSLGISLKGGTDNNLPILVSKVCRSDSDDHLFIGDAIVKVNHTLMTSVTHEEAIDILQNAGDEVTLTVKHYKSAAPFLLKNFRQLIPEQQADHSSKPRGSASTPSDEKNSCEGQKILLRQKSIDSPSPSNWHGIPKVKRKWVDVLEVPLLTAYITRYIFGTDKLRPNGFEVRGINGSNTGVIQCSDLAVLSHWIKLINDHITTLTSQRAALFNRKLGPTDQITYMNWVAEGILDQDQPWQSWKPVFFVLRGSELTTFDTPPLELEEALDVDSGSNCRYQICQAMFRVIKESENVDERQHCFLIQTCGQESRYFSMETRHDLLKVESAWHRAVCRAISQMGSKTFHVVYDNVPAALTLHWTDGFLLKPFASPTFAFTYNFSQLKGSSDDGNSSLKLLFQDPPGGKELVEQVMTCTKLQELLFVMHSFLTAKVASADPSFMDNNCSKPAKGNPAENLEEVSGLQLSS